VLFVVVFKSGIACVWLMLCVSGFFPILDSLTIFKSV
jgi:hypothetical protein